MEIYHIFICISTTIDAISPMMQHYYLTFYRMHYYFTEEQKGSYNN